MSTNWRDLILATSLPGIGGELFERMKAGGFFFRAAGGSRAIRVPGGGSWVDVVRLGSDSTVGGLAASNSGMWLRGGSIGMRHHVLLHCSDSLIISVSANTAIFKGYLTSAQCCKLIGMLS